MQRSMFLKLRVSLDEAERFNVRAAALGVSVSQLIRDTALHGAVTVCAYFSGASASVKAGCARQHPCADGPQNQTKNGCP